MKKYNEFITEKKKDVAPYSEEDWSPRPRKRDWRELEKEREMEMERERQQCLDILSEQCPSAYYADKYGYKELMCNAYEFVEMLEKDPESVSFAGNSPSFDDPGSLRNVLSELENMGAENLKIGTIHVHYDNEIYAAAIYFTGIGKKNKKLKRYIDSLEPDEFDYHEGEWRVWWD